MVTKQACAHNQTLSPYVGAARHDDFDYFRNRYQ
jgi:hypothetical protein